MRRGLQRSSAPALVRSVLNEGQDVMRCPLTTSDAPCWSSFFLRLYRAPRGGPGQASNPTQTWNYCASGRTPRRQESRPRRKSARISRAALWPGAPVTPPPGWVPEPHMYSPCERSAVIAVPEHRPRREQLIEAQRAVEDVAADEAEGALEIERAHDLPAEHRGLEIRRMAVDQIDHEVGDLLAVRRPTTRRPAAPAPRAGRTGSPRAVPAARGCRPASMGSASRRWAASTSRPPWRRDRPDPCRRGSAP